ncbi:MAG: hypothetical protein QOH99_286, partial [Frankiaceae bacterium]|nr:hypothetical protein [Frankiaceae bacterium]
MTTDDAPHEHLSVETAADFDERLLDAAASADVAARVAACATCAGALDAVHRTRAALADLPPIPMPPAIADRLHAALAAETQASLVPGGAATVTALAKPARRFWIPVGVGVAAAGALIFALQLNGRSADTNPSAATRAAASSTPSNESLSANIRTLASGTDYATAARSGLAAGLQSAPVAGPAVDSGGFGYKANVPQPAATPGGTTTASATAVPSPTNASALSAGSGSASDTSTSADQMSVGDLSQYGPLRNQATLDACILRLIDPAAPVQPTTVDFASYAGKPAVAIFFPAT